jgi:phospholipase A1/A2
MQIWRLCLRLTCLTAIVWIYTSSSWAAQPDLNACKSIRDNMERLSCYDLLVSGKTAEPPNVESTKERTSPTDRVRTDTFLNEQIASATQSPLGRAWELDPVLKGGIFRFRFHKPIYFLPLRYTDDPNRNPSSPPYKDVPVSQFDEMEYVETKFQLSFKTKLWENLFRGNGDIWFGYTQQSHWQLYNSDVSAPFRETNYEPELILTWRTDLDIPGTGFNWRMINLGLVHQSNGRSEPLSRSWNRVYAQFGIEKGDFVLMVRPWMRLEEDKDTDDNPDIDQYMGTGDILTHYKYKGNVFSLLGRYSFEGQKGAVQFDWAFPIYKNLKANLQLFSGYGENLLDYNQYQNVIGLGFSLANWQ